MKLTFFSDTHYQHDKLKFTEGDILIFCGDLTTHGAIYEVENFSGFMKRLNYQHKIVIAGNHDFCFSDQRRETAEECFFNDGLIYLNDSGVEIEGIKFWGSPVQPWFHNWAFNRKRGEEIRKHWNLIPHDTDVLITHGPPFGIMDLCADGEQVGCVDLLNAVKNIRPKIHAFGHIHESHGCLQIDNTTFINASSLDEKYKNPRLPIDIEI